MSISALENYRRMMNHDSPEWLPLQMGATPPIEDLIEEKKGTRDPGEAFDLDFRWVSYAWPKFDEQEWRDALEGIGYVFPENSVVEQYGITHVLPPRDTLGKAYHLREMVHPLSGITSIAQLESLPWPDPDDTRLSEGLREQVEAIHEAGYVAVSHSSQQFEPAWYLRSMDMLFMDLLEDNGISDWLLDYFSRMSVRMAEESTKAGADVIVTGDDVGTQRGMMMAVDFWREHLMERMKAVADAIAANQTENHTRMYFHSDGDIRDILHILVEFIDILNPVQPECMPAIDVIPKYKDRIAFWGIIGTQTTMPFGTPGDIWKVVEECAQFAREGAAIVIAPTHILEPDVPWENITALVKAVKETQL